MNLGVRYDYYSPITDALGQTSTFVVRQPDNGTPQSGVAEVIIAGTNGLPENSTYFPDKNNVQPRVGFAWDIFGDGRLALRGGGGVFHNQLRNNLALQHILSYPFQEQPVYRDTTLENPIKPVDGHADHRPAVLDRPRHRDALHGRLQRRAAVAVRQEHGGRGGVRAERRQGPPAVRGDEPAVLRRRADDRGSTRICSGRIEASARCCDRPTGATPTTRGSRRASSAGSANGLAFGVVLHAGDLARPDRPGSIPGATSTTYLLKPQDSDNPEAEYAASDFDARHRFTASEIWDLPVRRRPPLAQGRARCRTCLADGRSRACGRSRAGSPTTSSTAPIRACARAATPRRAGRTWSAIPTPARRRRRSGSTPAPTQRTAPVSSAARRATRSAARAW